MRINHMHVPIWLRILAKLVSIGLSVTKVAQTASGRGVLKRLKSCGKGVGVWGRFHVTGAEQMSVGSNVHFGDNAFIRAEGGLVIGDNTHISRNLVLYTINHDYEGTRIPYDHQMVEKMVTIGRNVWIGMNVCIAPGTVIGDGAIIGMGTVVSGTVPSMAIIGNEKWKLLGERNQTRYDSLNEARAFGGPGGVLFEPNDE